ncbi:MAG TPA: bifunctional glycosyltransferase family 2/GtrA family protein [Acidobacteriaceae bacterium]|jgi:glycosyltransferase involved in cell wall biosynthesis
MIPAWKPESGLLDLAASLSEAGFGLVLVIDDGSGDAGRAIFDELDSRGITVIRHAVNLGKGRALKTGFNYLLTQHPEMKGVVTADADGQHTVIDIVHVGEALLRSGACAVLGARTFGGDVPMRSKFGNELTRHIFGFVTGMRLRDTQTGLRGLPLSLLPSLMTLDGERYEYEMTMLAHLCREGQRPTEVPIATVYIEGNRSSHFNPVWDSMRIYFVLARFFFSSIVAAGIDFLGFTITFALTHNILASVAIGRLSSLVNFALNKRFVFHNRTSLVAALWRYYALAAVIFAASYGLIWTLNVYLRWNVFAAKICVDVLLSLVSFSVQRTFIFRKSEAV